MKLLYIVDGRSPIALNWISHFILGGHEVHLVSTYPCAAVEGVASQYIIPMALSSLYAQTSPLGGERSAWLRRLLPVRVRTAIRQMAAPLSFPQAITRLQGIIGRVQPELIHAMRIPYEGVLTAEALRRTFISDRDARRIPLLVSVWGNDFTLHAEASKMMAEQTQQVLQACNALHTDCQRDQRLATEWGFEPQKPRIVLPGGGGVQVDVFQPSGADRGQSLGNAPFTILNPRGFRTYVQNDTFFQSIPMVIERHREVRFICTGMLGEGQAHAWVQELGIQDKVELLPVQPRLQMAELFRQAQISLSITTHDGTPNTLLEAMACGCFPIAGDIESIREWIVPGLNGMLIDPGDPVALASAIVEAINHPEIRAHGKEMNLKQVMERGEYRQCMQAAEAFYHQLILNFNQ